MKEFDFIIEATDGTVPFKFPEEPRGTNPTGPIFADSPRILSEEIQDAVAKLALAQNALILLGEEDAAEVIADIASALEQDAEDNA